ncbi:hypothetical protein L2E82_51168 [Cichorium intybus]|nr:hypothetical protein L2E82_51168 [Cichorium intybus]
MIWYDVGVDNERQPITYFGYILFLVLSRLDTMEPKEKPVQLKVYVDKKKTKVMFAEAEEDFVDILFSFFTLPLGIIARLSKKHADSKEIRVGSLTSLYESSTEDLNVVPVKLNTSIVLLNSLGVENINVLEERTIRFGFEEQLWQESDGDINCTKIKEETTMCTSGGSLCGTAL